MGLGPDLPGSEIKLKSAEILFLNLRGNVRLFEQCEQEAFLKKMIKRL